MTPPTRVCEQWHHHYSGDTVTPPLQWGHSNTITTAGNCTAIDTTTAGNGTAIDTTTVGTPRQTPLQWGHRDRHHCSGGTEPGGWSHGTTLVRTVVHSTHYPGTTTMYTTTVYTTTVHPPSPTKVSPWLTLSVLTKLVPNTRLIKPLSAYKRQTQTC